MTATWTCDSCGKLASTRPGMDDSFDCFCERCMGCHELTYECLCDDDQDGYSYEGDQEETE